MKKIISTVLAVLAFLPACASAKCSDWAADEIEYAGDVGIIYASDTEQDYTEAISREGFCELIYNMINVSTDEAIKVDIDKCAFTDTENGRVRVLCAMGIINGKSDTEFAPNDLLTREEAATIVVRTVNRIKPLPVTEMWHEFADIKEISDWAMDSVQTVCNMDFMAGVGDNRFAPKDTYMAEQAIVTLTRVYDAWRIIGGKDAPTDIYVSDKAYKYNTPLGVIESDTDYNSFINFAIEANAYIDLVQDTSRFDETWYVTEEKVKALTNQTTSMYISFDDFAELLGGEWKLNRNNFEFTYDEAKTISMHKHTENIESITDWPNKYGKVDAVIFNDMSTITVNGVETEIKAMWGGKVFNSNIVMYNETLYIPVQMVAELIGYDIASLVVAGE